MKPGIAHWFRVEKACQTTKLVAKLLAATYFVRPSMAPSQLLAQLASFCTLSIGGCMHGDYRYICRIRHGILYRLGSTCCQYACRTPPRPSAPPPPPPNVSDSLGYR